MGDAMELLKKRQADPKGGWRPNFKRANKPPDVFIAELKAMWEDDPDKRPPASQVREFMDTLVKNN